MIQKKKRQIKEDLHNETQHHDFQLQPTILYYHLYKIVLEFFFHNKSILFVIIYINIFDEYKNKVYIYTYLNTICLHQLSHPLLQYNLV